MFRGTPDAFIYLHPKIARPAIFKEKSSEVCCYGKNCVTLGLASMLAGFSRISMTPCVYLSAESWCLYGHSSDTGGPRRPGCRSWRGHCCFGTASLRCDGWSLRRQQQQQQLTGNKQTNITQASEWWTSKSVAIKQLWDRFTLTDRCPGPLPAGGEVLCTFRAGVAHGPETGNGGRGLLGQLWTLIGQCRGVGVSDDWLHVMIISHHVTSCRYDFIICLSLKLNNYK